MEIQNQRIHIAGSASNSIETSLLKYAHDLIFQLVKYLASEGAKFIVGVGKEPLSDSETSLSLPLIFDWTVLAALGESLKEGSADAVDSHGRLITTVATSKLNSQIPESRRELWDFLLNFKSVELEFLRHGLSSGALRRQKLSSKGDILIVIGGGEGVEHLAEDEYIAKSKPVIPFDLSIGSSCYDGSGGACRLAKEALANPNRFICVSDTTLAGSLLSGLSTLQGRQPISKVVQSTVTLIRSIEPYQQDTPSNRKVSEISGDSTPRKLLFLASSPLDEARLRLDQESREISEGLRRSTYGNQYSMDQRWAVRPDDFRRALLDSNPNIVHFSGHGAGSAGLILEDVLGNAKPVPTNATADLFRLFVDRGLECVVLNACYSETQAKAIVQYVPYVIGMSNLIGDAAAIKFAVGFYDALGANWPYRDAYELGCNAIEFDDITKDLIPVFYAKNGN
ncbi:hypothetical protein Lepto7375DRAFT_3782 [Leptolyngbya sp. PCC 7375]|nr:hypothetical protein Lepto7375DRAFT_3782 [Leptolyngbya sp. PCC 7375]